MLSLRQPIAVDSFNQRHSNLLTTDQERREHLTIISLREITKFTEVWTQQTFKRVDNRLMWLQQLLHRIDSSRDRSLAQISQKNKVTFSLTLHKSQEMLEEALWLVADQEIKVTRERGEEAIRIILWRSITFLRAQLTKFSVAYSKKRMTRILPTPVDLLTWEHLKTEISARLQLQPLTNHWKTLKGSLHPLQLSLPSNHLSFQDTIKWKAKLQPHQTSTPESQADKTLIQGVMSPGLETMV